MFDVVSIFLNILEGRVRVPGGLNVRVVRVLVRVFVGDVEISTVSGSELSSEREEYVYMVSPVVVELVGDNGEVDGCSKSEHMLEHGFFREGASGVGEEGMTSMKVIGGGLTGLVVYILHFHNLILLGTGDTPFYIKKRGL